MREAGIGRVLVASLHQGIADLLPTRLGFYENWLSVEGLRGGTIGLAPMSAVLSFLRQESGNIYQVLTARAGAYAAEWTVQAMPQAERAFIKAAPYWLRQRLALRLARRVVLGSYKGSGVLARLEHGTASVELRGSIFCTVREPVKQPLCGFYASALTRLFLLFELTSHTEIVSCRATGGSSCVLTIALSEDEAGEKADAAADTTIARVGS
jgi:hypothetical protein